MAIYEDYYGIIVPKGYVIHHKDDNPHNNDIDNLELKENSKHIKDHMEAYYADKKNYEKSIKHLNKIREMTKERHRGEE